MTIKQEFKEASSRAAIRGLRGLEQTAIMLETYASDVFPEVNEQGQKHFGRVMMESAAQSIRDAWSSAIVEVENFPDDPQNLIESHGRLRQSLLEIAAHLHAASIQASPRDDQIISGHVRDALGIAKEALKSGVLKHGIPQSNL